MTYAAKHAKEGDPKDEKDKVPDPDEGESENEWNEVEQGCDGRQPRDDFSIHLRQY